MTCTKKIKIHNKTGLHMRPGKLFVQEAQKYTSTITIIKDNKSYNGKSLIKMMKTGIVAGDELTLVTDGPDEELASAKLSAFIAQLEG